MEMEPTLNTVIEQVSRDKSIDKQVLIVALEEAILTAARKAFGENRALEAHYNEEKALVEVTQTIRIAKVVNDSINQISIEEAQARGVEAEDGDELVFQIYYREQDNQEAKEQDELYGDILKLKTYRRSFGRIAAQTARQVIMQRVRDVERDTVYQEYKDRKGELITGVVRRFEHGSVIIDLGRAEAILPQKEQCPREIHRTGERVQAYVLDVQRFTKGPQIILSRVHPGLLIKLFELEVPEVGEGVVKIESAAREPSSRAKIAVWSKDRDVDPVGACVGMKGSRVQAIVQELRGEKIDIVPFDEDPARYVCNALAPAEVSRVVIDDMDHAMEIVVPDDQLSLAIGRKGQNVRLAAQLTGWRLDIHSESKVKEIKDQAAVALAHVEGCNEFIIQTLYNYGIRSAAALAQVSRDSLLEIPGVNEENVDRMLQSAKVAAVNERAQEKRAKEDAQRAEKTVKIARALQNMLSQRAETRFKKLKGSGETIAKKLIEGGFLTLESVTHADESVLAALLGGAERKAVHLKHAAAAMLREEQQLKEEARGLGITIQDDRTIVLPQWMQESLNAARAQQNKSAASVEAPSVSEDVPSLQDEPVKESVITADAS